MSTFFSVYRYSGNLSVAGGISTADSITAGKKVTFWFRAKVSYWSYLIAEKNFWGIIRCTNIILSSVTEVHFMYNSFKIMYACKRFLQKIYAYKNEINLVKAFTGILEE